MNPAIQRDWIRDLTRPALVISISLHIGWCIWISDFWSGSTRADRGPAISVLHLEASRDHALQQAHPFDARLYASLGALEVAFPDRTRNRLDSLGDLIAPRLGQALRLDDPLPPGGVSTVLAEQNPISRHEKGTGDLIVPEEPVAALHRDSDTGGAGALFLSPIEGGRAIVRVSLTNNLVPVDASDDDYAIVQYDERGRLQSILFDPSFRIDPSARDRIRAAIMVLPSPDALTNRYFRLHRGRVGMGSP